jgi:Uma2 family endonuclease
MSRTVPQRPRAVPSRIPPLQNGDHLTREEFERRYDATPDIKKAELIEGKVYMAPPISHLEHGRPHARLVGLLSLYAFQTSQVDIGDNSSLRLDVKNMPQPDIFVLIAPTSGGQAQIDDEGYIVGAPELVAEVAASSASYDLHEKLEVYRRNKVREYLVWRTQEQQIDYFILRNGQYQLMQNDNGIYKSEIFPGLWIDAVSLLSENVAQAAALMQQGIASPEHASFVAELHRRAGNA